MSAPAAATVTARCGDCAGAETLTCGLCGGSGARSDDPASDDYGRDCPACYGFGAVPCACASIDTVRDLARSAEDGWR